MQNLVSSLQCSFKMINNTSYALYASNLCVNIAKDGLLFWFSHNINEDIFMAIIKITLIMCFIDVLYQAIVLLFSFFHLFYLLLSIWLLFFDYRGSLSVLFFAHYPNIERFWRFYITNKILYFFCNYSWNILYIFPVYFVI